MYRNLIFNTGHYDIYLLQSIISLTVKKDNKIHLQKLTSPTCQLIIENSNAPPRMKNTGKNL